ncbi:MAG: hypothetical protein AB7T22_05565 [Calditrichaceae bacterium]
MKIGYSNNIIKNIIFVIFLFIIAGTHRAKASENVLIEVQSMVDTSTITIGDRILYSIIIDRAENLRIEKPGEGLNLGMFEIKDYKFHDPEKKDGRIIERYDFSISVFDTGRFTIPPFPIAYFPSDTSNRYQIIDASPIDIYVKSVLANDEAPELKDVKPPIDILFNYKFWILVLSVILLVGVLVYLGFRFWKRRKEKGYIFSPPPTPEPAHQIALKALDKLFRSDLLEKGHLKLFFTELSDILRRYLEGRYYLSALEETTTEIMRDLKKHLADESIRQDLLDVLVMSDLVKFAKHTPGMDETEPLKIKARSFVDQTKIIYESEPEKNNQENDPLLPAAELNDEAGNH